MLDLPDNPDQTVGLMRLAMSGKPSPDDLPTGNSLLLVKGNDDQTWACSKTDLSDSNFTIRQLNDNELTQLNILNLEFPNEPGQENIAQTQINDANKEFFEKLSRPDDSFQVGSGPRPNVSLDQDGKKPDNEISSDAPADPNPKNDASEEAEKSGRGIYDAFRALFKSDAPEKFVTTVPKFIVDGTKDWLKKHGQLPPDASKEFPTGSPETEEQDPNTVAQPVPSAPPLDNSSSQVSPFQGALSQNLAPQFQELSKNGKDGNPPSKDLIVPAFKNQQHAALPLTEQALPNPNDSPKPEPGPGPGPGTLKVKLS